MHDGDTIMANVLSQSWHGTVRILLFIETHQLQYHQDGTIDRLQKATELTPNKNIFESIGLNLSAQRCVCQLVVYLVA